MKILHVAQSLDIITPLFSGGRGRFIYNLAKKQAEQGHNVTVIATNRSNIPGCKIKTITDNTLFERGLGRRVFEVKHVSQSFMTADKDIDIIHNHAEWEGAFLSGLSTKPIVTTIHGVITSQTPGKLFSLLCNVPYQSKYVTYSKTAYNDLKPYFKQKLLSHVYPSIDISLFKCNDSTKDDALKLCCIGRLTPEKGFHTAIKIADKLHQNGIKVTLSLVGTVTEKSLHFNEYVKSILQAVRERPYVDIKINAWFGDVARVYQNSDATLMPIEWSELFGFVVAESMACGTPVIGYGRGALVELISQGKTGYICRSFDELYTACLSVDKLNRRSCRQFVEDNFTFQTTYNGYNEIYKKIISEQ